MPRITVIIPCFNSVEFIESTICSILDQNYPDKECIVIDGGSTDGTIDILKKYHDRIIWISEPDYGQSHAINKGIERATGDILAYLNADDIYENSCFEKVADFYKNNPETKWVFGKCRIINITGREIYKPVTWFKNFWLKNYSYRYLLLLNFLSQPSIFWHRSLTQEIGIFDVNEHLVMDYDYWLRAGRRYKPGYIPQYLASFRLHHSSKTVANPAKALKYGSQVVNKYTKSKLVKALHYLISLFIAVFYITTKIGNKHTT